MTFAREPLHRQRYGGSPDAGCLCIQATRTSAAAGDFRLLSAFVTADAEI